MRHQITYHLFLVCFLFLIGTVQHLFAFTSLEEKATDSTKTYAIREVIVVEKYPEREIRSASPLQILTSKDLQSLNVLQISDAVKYFSGVSVKDYGGIGGLKTVSVRSLGAEHTAINYDGITVSDIQTGQIDIGRYSLDNVEIISLNNGQSDQIFQPARQFASAAVLNIVSKRPDFKNGHNFGGMLKYKGGSWGMTNPSFYFEKRLGQHSAAIFNGEWLSAQGDYPYTFHYGNSSNDSTSYEKRKNTDVKNLRIEATLYQKDSVQNGYVKTYLYASKRGLPGATIFYNSDNFSSQRLNSKTFFVQGHYERKLSQLFKVQGNIKYNYGYLYYLDTTSLNSECKVENTYRQQEYYISGSILYFMFENLSLAYSTDGYINKLQANLANFAEPTRYTWLNNIAGKYVNRHIIASANILCTAIDETVKNGDAANNRLRLSPYAGISVKPWLNADIRFRAFYKNIFRMPNFNDLYYGRIGNIDLKPENANQINAGITYLAKLGTAIPMFKFTVDAYHNRITDKIVAYPTKNIYVWTMLNLGKVSTTGMDLTGQISIIPTYKTTLILGGTYSYMRALDVTDANSRTYKNQIPYTPRISGSEKILLEVPWANISYNVIWSGKRYAGFQNYAVNRLDGFADQSISISRTFKIKKQMVDISAECLNITNKNYAIVRFFPMPGRNWRVTVKYKW